jgi:glucan phosphoethanolaminetransferase (alkaline phosphatase superfamily)
MLCAAVCGVLTFKLPFFSGQLQKDPAKGFVLDYLTAASTPWLVIIGVALTVGILVNIFNFRKRKQQLAISIALILLSLLNIVVYWFAAHNRYIGGGTVSLSALLALAIPVFLILATRGIAKDEKLVKSADRLR